MMQRIQILAKYTRRGASSRLRLHQFIPAFEAAGFSVSFASLFDDRYLDGVYTRRGTSLWHLFCLYLARMRELRLLDRRVTLLIEGELFPWLPGFVERWVLSGRNYVLDFDDAIFHRYDLHRTRLVRLLLGRKIDRLMAGAVLVIAGNDYLADRAMQAGARVVDIVPTVVDTDRYPLADFHSSHEPFRVGWIGTPITWEAYGQSLFEMLSERFAGEPVKFIAIGAATTARQVGNIHIIPWSEDTEASHLGKLSVGLMPLENTPWARGKCAYKLIQYLACGVPVIASPVGANCEVVRDGENGFLAETGEDWVAAVATVLADRARAREMGLAGRAQIQERYSTQFAGPHLARLLARLSNDR